MKTAHQKPERTKLKAENWRECPRWGGPAGPPYAPSHLQHAPFVLKSPGSFGSSGIRLYYTYPALWLAASPSQHPHHEHQQPAGCLCSTVPLGSVQHPGIRILLITHADSIISYSTDPSSSFSPALKSQASCFLSITCVSPAHPLWSRPHKTHLLDISSPWIPTPNYIAFHIPFFPNFSA